MNEWNQWLFDHVWVTYAIIYVLVAYVYNKVFRVKKLPLLKNVIVYLLIGAGTFLLLIFQMFGLPIILSLALAVSLMLIVRVRAFVESRTKGRPKKEQEG